MKEFQRYYLPMLFEVQEKLSSLDESVHRPARERLQPDEDARRPQRPQRQSSCFSQQHDFNMSGQELSLESPAWDNGDLAPRTRRSQLPPIDEDVAAVQNRGGLRLEDILVAVDDRISKPIETIQRRIDEIETRIEGVKLLCLADIKKLSNSFDLGMTEYDQVQQTKHNADIAAISQELLDIRQALGAGGNANPQVACQGTAQNARNVEIPGVGTGVLVTPLRDANRSYSGAVNRAAQQPPQVRFNIPAHAPRDRPAQQPQVRPPAPPNKPQQQNRPVQQLLARPPAPPNKPLQQNGKPLQDLPPTAPVRQTTARTTANPSSQPPPRTGHVEDYNTPSAVLAFLPEIPNEDLAAKIANAIPILRSKFFRAYRMRTEVQPRPVRIIPYGADGGIFVHRMDEIRAQLHDDLRIRRWMAPDLKFADKTLVEYGHRLKSDGHITNFHIKGFRIRIYRGGHVTGRYQFDTASGRVVLSKEDPAIFDKPFSLIRTAQLINTGAEMDAPRMTLPPASSMLDEPLPQAALTGRRPLQPTPVTLPPVTHGLVQA